MHTSIAYRDKSIHLFTKFKNQGIKIRDHWPDDEMAVGHTDKASKYLVYISTSGQPEDQVYISLKNLFAGWVRPYKPAGDFDNIPLKELERIISEHLRL